MSEMFSSATGAAIARSRQHSVGDPLHRTARRYPDKLAVVAGDRRVGPDNPPYEVAGVEMAGSTVIVEWTNGTGIRVREYDANAGVLVDRRLVEHDG